VTSRVKPLMAPRVVVVRANLLPRSNRRNNKNGRFGGHFFCSYRRKVPE
jgi:hypothetical protein